VIYFSIRDGRLETGWAVAAMEIRPSCRRDRAEEHEGGSMRLISGVLRALLRAALGVKPPVPEPPLRVPAITTGDPELDPLVSFLRVWFAREIEAGRILVIEDHTAVQRFFMEGSYEDYVDRLLKQASDQAPAEMIRNFGDKNRESYVVWTGAPWRPAVDCRCSSVSTTPGSSSRGSGRAGSHDVGGGVRSPAVRSRSPSGSRGSSDGGPISPPPRPTRSTAPPASAARSGG
jgi:hypothetical protein